MRGAEEHCDNCGCFSAFVAIFSPDQRTRRCSTCGGWSFAGDVSLPATQLYDRDYFFGGEYVDYGVSAPAQRKNFARKLRILDAKGCPVREGARVLEIGCATGEFLALLGKIPRARCVGIEVSPYALTEARSRGLSVFAPDDPNLAAALEDLRPDFIVAWDVWEHLPKPATIVGDLLRRAAPDLVVALTTVDAGSVIARVRGARWRQFHPPTHLHYPTRRSFETFFAAHSLELVAQQAFGYYRPVLEYTLALGIDPTRALPRRALAAPVYLNLWDTQLVIARRRA